MSPECIHPEYRDWIHLIADSSAEEIEALDFGELGYLEMCESRLHWNCCPSCRHEFPTLPAIAEQAGRGYEKLFAADFSIFRDRFLAIRGSLSESSNGDAYVRAIASLAAAEDEIHDGLRRALMVTQNLYVGVPLESDPYKREIMSCCREFVSSLEPEVQRFVIAATLCFELLRPMWEKVGLSPRFDKRTPEQVDAEVDAEVEALLAGEQAENSTQEPPRDVVARLRSAITDSALEPRVLWDVIEAAARAHVGSREGAESPSLLPPWIRKFEEDFDNFSESMKATQMVAVRLSERNIRKAADYGPEIAERIGSRIYSRLHDGTKRQLEVAEFLYEANRQEPRYGHGPAINLALACENELNLRLTWPILKELVDSGTRYYRAEKKPGERFQPPPLIDGNQIQEKHITLGRIGYYLGKHPDFGDRARARGFNPDVISRDVLEVKAVRDKAAHQPNCELAEVDKIRSLILRSDGIFSFLHPDAGVNPKD